MADILVLLLMALAWAVPFLLTLAGVWLVGLAIAGILDNPK